MNTQNDSIDNVPLIRTYLSELDVLLDLSQAPDREDIKLMVREHITDSLVIRGIVDRDPQRVRDVLARLGSPQQIVGARGETPPPSRTPHERGWWAIGLSAVAFGLAFIWWPLGVLLSALALAVSFGLPQGFRLRGVERAALDKRRVSLTLVVLAVIVCLYQALIAGVFTGATPPPSPASQSSAPSSE